MVTKRTRHITSYFIVGVLSIGMLALSGCIGGTGKYDVEIDKEVRSPDGKTIATFYIISGGGAAGYVIIRLKIRPRSQTFKEDDNYVFEMRHGDDLGLKWQGNNHLIVTFEAGADVYRKLSSKDNIQITYIPQKVKKLE